MGQHSSYTNDPVLQIGLQIHVPGFSGTNAQRMAYNTSFLSQSMQWYETDTALTYQWTGTAWQLLGSGVVGVSGSVISGPLTVTTTLAMNQRLTII